MLKAPMLKASWAQAALAWLLGLYLALALRTTRWTLVGAHHVAPCFADRPAVVAFWHARLPFMPKLWLLARAAGAPMGLHVLVSRHRDGRLIGTLMRRFGVGLVFGSSSRGGPAGLRAAADRLAAGDHIVITPDGPRGPPCIAAPGVAQLAAIAGVPVLPAAAQTTRRIVLNSWDRMAIPLPFGRGVIVCGPPIAVRRENWQASLPAIAAALDEATRHADRLCMPPAEPSKPGALAAAAWSLAARLATPALRLLLARRVRTGRENPARLHERRGIEPAPRPPGRLLWLHAASVGETISVLPVLHALAAAAPHATLLLTTGTLTSAAIAAERLPQGALHRFVPLDVPRWVARFLDHWQPDAAAFVESEIWPNMLAAAARRRIPCALLNARLSERSAAHWQRVPGLARRLFAGFLLIQPRSADDAARIARLAGRPCAPPADLKFAAADLPADPAALATLRAALAGAPVWVAASLHPGEQTIVTELHHRLRAAHPGLVTILVPRHPARGAEWARPGSIARRAAGAMPAPGHPYIADTLGELGLWYRLATCVFIGGSLVPHGGQNPLEPARLGRPVAIGPHAGNFAEACAVLRTAGALADVADPPALQAWAGAMLSDPQAAAAAGQAAARAASRWADLPARTAAALLALAL